MAQVNITIQAGAEQSNVSVATNPAVNISIQATTGPPLAVESGTWTPAFNILQGASSVTSQRFQYLRVGNMVHFTGYMSVNINASGEKLFTFTLPAASAIGTGNLLIGTISSSTTNGYGYVANDANSAFVLWSTTTTGIHSLIVQGQYPIQ